MHCCKCRYQKCAKLADAMEKGLHYTVDEKQKSILLTEDGYETAEDILGVSALLHGATLRAEVARSCLCVLGQLEE